MSLVLSVIVPTYNMEKYLRTNLESLAQEEFIDRLEVLVMDNSSGDSSGIIADEYAEKYPSLFTVIHKENRGYGSSINLGISIAKGAYLRIVDADDWVLTDGLRSLLQMLENCCADLVETNYITCRMDNGVTQTSNILPSCVQYNKVYSFSQVVRPPLPTIHSTTFRTDLLRNSNISLLENTFYVDEQLMVLTGLVAKSIVYTDISLYCYRIGNNAQSVSAISMGKHFRDRERVIKNCISACQSATIRADNKKLCTEQVAQNIGNHFTTLYMYVLPRQMGRRLAKEWRIYIQKAAPFFIKNRYQIFRQVVLCFFNYVHLSPGTYKQIKTLIRRIFHD